MTGDWQRMRGPFALVRIVQARRHLLTCGVIMVLTAGATALATNWRVATRLCAAWDVGAALYLALAFEMMRRADIAGIRRRAAEQDEGQLTILVLTVAAPVASLAATFALVGGGPTANGGRHVIQLVLPSVTVLLSWTLIHTLFALHYAHEYYDEIAGGGLAFPGDDREPDYWDFVYFSFVIGMTSQVSDVSVTGKSMRRIVAAHGVVSFVFNVALLALMVNVAASAI